MKGLLVTVHSVGKGFGRAVRGVARLVGVPFGAIKRHRFRRNHLAPRATSSSLVADDRRRWQSGNRAEQRQDEEELLTGMEKFPCQACSKNFGMTRVCQDLTTTGSKFWGNWWDGRSFLRVKLYDFAVYMNPDQVQKSSTSRDRPAFNGKTKVELLRELHSSHEVPMSLFVRAARNLPIKLLSREYESILRRRLVSVGASPQDPGLEQLVEMFHEDRVPQHIKDKGSLRKGTLLTFAKDTSGTLTTSVDNIQLGTISSRALCDAIFDLYLGEKPVSKKARSLAGDAVLGYMSGGKAPVHWDVCTLPDPALLPA